MLNLFLLDFLLELVLDLLLDIRAFLVHDRPFLLLELFEGLHFYLEALLPRLLQHELRQRYLFLKHIANQK